MKTKRNETKRNQQKRNETKRNQQKRNETKRNQRNENEIKTTSHTCLSVFHQERTGFDHH